MITIDLTKTSTTELAPFVAALELGNKRLADPIVTQLISSLNAVLCDGEHYLLLRDPDDLDSFFGCGDGRGAKDTMVEDGRLCRLYALPQAECPNCREDDDPY